MNPRLISILLLLVTCSANGEERAAVRIISLAPHITEILFEIGAGEQIVGTVSYSDYPNAAKEIPRIGGYNRLDLESILEKRPDLVLGWESGNSPVEIEQLKALGLHVVVTEPRQLGDVAALMERYGQLVGREEQARKKAARYRQRLQQLRDNYQHQLPLTVFYQVWNSPLITVNGEQIISDVVELCGGVNVFASLDTLSPRVSVEAVLEKNSQVIIASGMDESRPEWLDGWSQYPTLQAVQNGNLYHVPPDILQRHGPRLVKGVEAVCRVLAMAREK